MIYSVGRNTKRNRTLIVQLPNLNTILKRHKIPPKFWPELRAFLEEGVQPGKELQTRLDYVANYKAERLRCSEMTVYRLCREGKLAHRRIGVGRGVIRVRAADLDSFAPTVPTLPSDIAAKRRRYLGF